MVELIDLKNWKKMKEIKLELHREYGINLSRDGREFRNAVEKWNNLFFDGKVPYFITHSVNYGYKATTDWKEAMQAKNDLIVRSRNMERKARRIQKGFELLNNCKYDFETGEII